MLVRWMIGGMSEESLRPLDPTMGMNALEQH